MFCRARERNFSWLAGVLERARALPPNSSKKCWTSLVVTLQLEHDAKAKKCL